MRGPPSATPGLRASDGSGSSTAPLDELGRATGTSNHQTRTRKPTDTARVWGRRRRPPARVPHSVTAAASVPISSGLVVPSAMAPSSSRVAASSPVAIMAHAAFGH